MKGDPKKISELLKEKDGPFTDGKSYSAAELKSVGEYILKKAEELQDEENCVNDFRSFMRYLKFFSENNLLEKVILEPKAADSEPYEVKLYTMEVHPVLKEDAEEEGIPEEFRKIYSNFNNMSCMFPHKVCIKSVGRRDDVLDFSTLNCDIVIKNMSGRLPITEIVHL